MSALTVLVTGGTGAVGTGIVRALVRNQLKVLGLARSEQSAEKLRALGAEPVPGELAKLDWHAAVSRSDAVVHAGLDWTAPRETQKEITRWLMQQAAGKTLVYTGGTWCFGDGEHTEESPLERGHGWDWMIEDIEAVLEADSFRGIVVNPPRVYGWDPATGECTGWLRAHVEELRSRGSLQIVGSPSRRQAVGHADDVGEVYAAALLRGKAGRMYNAGAISTTSGEMAAAAAAVAGVSPLKMEVIGLSTAVERMGASGRGCNMDQVLRSPAIEALGWRPAHRTLPGAPPQEDGGAA